MQTWLVRVKIDTYAEVVVEAETAQEARDKSNKDETMDDWSYETDYDSSVIYEVVPWEI